MSLPERREVREGENVEVSCKVEANPVPTRVQWLKEGEPEFVQVTGAKI